jgi:5-(carboxyamino)imidazole ribonucleotide mutase
MRLLLQHAIQCVSQPIPAVTFTGNTAEIGASGVANSINFPSWRGRVGERIAFNCATDLQAMRSARRPFQERYDAACGAKGCSYNRPFLLLAAFGHRFARSGRMAGKPIAIIMGSQSDWATMKHAADTLDALGIAYEALIVSAHRTPDRLFKFAKAAKRKGFKVIIAGAGGAAHLPGMTASLTALPVLGVPMNTHALEGKDSVLSILQMPAGIPVGTLAIGKPGAINAALLAASVLALSDARLAKRLDAWRARQTEAVARRPT